MGERAKAFWIREEQPQEQPREAAYEDIAFLCNGETDELWKYSAD